MASSTKITLKIVPFKNPSGLVVFRVTGSIYGERVQKNFPAELSARAFMNGLVRAANQGETLPERIATTTFPTDAELREAELAWRRLREQLPNGSLVTAVDYYLSHAGQVIRDGDARQILEEFIERRRNRGNQKNTVSVARTILRRFLSDAGIRRISEFTKERAEAFVFDTSVEVRTRRDRRDQLNNWAGYLVNQKYLIGNFVRDIDRPKITFDGIITTLTVDQVKALLKAAANEPVGRKKEAGAMLAYFATCSLSGVRPDEAKRLGRDWAWFSKDNQLITGFRAKNPKQARTVAIHPELVQILEFCRTKGFAPSRFSVKAFKRIRSKAGVLGSWDNDILRHTYASHHYAWKQDIGWLEKNMGNSEHVLKRSYLNQTVIEAMGKSLLSISLHDLGISAVMPGEVTTTSVEAPR